MNLPFIVDIAIGLIFVYITLSLLASEIQELLTTLLQWRAAHLKQSIQVLLAGGAEDEKVDQVKDLVHQLYDNPYIHSSNQEARGAIAQSFRQFTRVIGTIYRKLTGKDNIFGNKNSGPSYISGQTFAASLLDTVKFPEIVKHLKISRLEKFEVEKLEEIHTVITSLQITDEIKSHLESEYTQLGKKFDQIAEDFRNYKADLSTTIDRMSQQLDTYIENCQVYLPPSEMVAKVFVNKMNALKFNNDQEKAVLTGGWKPSLTDLVEEIRSNRRVYLELKKISEDKDSDFYQGIESLINSLPPSVLKGLDKIGQSTQAKIENVEEAAKNVEAEVSDWFDKSMERASGVYKRNSKGVAILIGVTIAIGVNADTLFIISRLSKDSVLRSTISQYGTKAITDNPDQGLGDFNQVKNKLDTALKNVDLPIGWDKDNMDNQEEYDQNLNNYNPILAQLRRVLGWLITGFSVSMGAKFWYDLLGKIVDVRNAGKKPETETETKSTSKSV